MDADSRAQVLADIEKYELSGEFDRHVDPVDYSIVEPVTKDFPYIRKGFDKIVTAFRYQFVVKPFRRKVLRDMIKPEVYGIENAKGILAYRADTGPIQWGTHLGELTFENVRFTGLRETSAPMASAVEPLTVTMKNVTVEFAPTAIATEAFVLREGANTVLDVQ